MREYYILDENDNWSKKVNIVHLYVKIINGKLHGFESIWYKGLCPDNANHPTNCIHGLIKLRDIKYIPSFLFQPKFGLIEIQKALNRKFGKKKKEIKFLTEPIDNEWYLKDAIKCLIVPTLRKISNLKSGQQYETDLIYQIKDNQEERTVKEPHKIRIAFKDTNYLKFQLIFEPSKRRIGGRDKKSYGLDDLIYLYRDDLVYEIQKNSISDFQTQIPFVPQIINGRILNLKQQTPSQYKDQYFRLVIPVKESETKMPSTYLERTGIMLFEKEQFNNYRTPLGPILRTGVTYQNFKIKEIDLHYFAPTDNLLVLESKSRINLDLFVQISNTVLLVSAFLSGDYYKEEKHYLSSDYEDFNSIDGIIYQAEQKNQLTNYQMINSELYVNIWEGSSKEYQNENHSMRKYFDLDVFNFLCELVIDNPEFKRSIEMIVEASSIDNSTLKGALYSVSLETITKFITKNNEDKVKPIPDKAIAKSLISEMKSKLEEYNDKITSSGKEIINRKIDNLNQPTNRDKLRIPFDLYNLTLNASDYKTIDNRNKYLHGNNPIESENEFELTQIALELHFLIGKLILKIAGYKGHVINLPVWFIWQDKSEYNKMIIASMEKQIQLIDKLKESLEDGDKAKFEETKANMIADNQDDKLSKVFELI